ncbi:MAG TPA: DinB family protein [Terriglobales bacterium]
MPNQDSGVPSPAELAAAVGGLERSRDAVLACCTGLSGDAWAHVDSPNDSSNDGAGRWTVADILEHMLLFETRYTAGLEESLRQPANPEWAAQTANKDAATAQAAVVRTPLVAPATMQPRGGIAPAELLAQWTAARAATIALAVRPGQALKSHTHPHRILGTISAYQGLLFIAAHTDRHRLQIERCLAAATPRS